MFHIFIKLIIKKKQKNESGSYAISINGWLYKWNENQRKGGLKIEETLLKLHSYQQKQFMLITQKQNQFILIVLKRNSIVDKQFNYVLIFINYTISELSLYSIPRLLIIRVFNSTSSISIIKPQFDFAYFNSNLIAAGTNKGKLLVCNIQKSSQPIQTNQISDQEKEIT
ncbi:unnamed protein product [Paramecium sonneborni]|uniref:Uncharacterized protein n=1 Tax=Paramecium sonneborni TaxID=65129 RepID=A0A8S1JTR3_9CILI|nr:unnamed protein product [Paramecium sonneborni]